MAVNTIPAASNPFADMFPVDRTDDSTPDKPADDEEKAILDKLHTAMYHMGIRKAAPHDDRSRSLPRPGSNYQRYRSESQLDDKSKMLYETAAKTVGVSLKTLVLAVYQTEGKIHGLTGHDQTRQWMESQHTAGSGNKDTDLDVDEPMEDIQT